MEIKPRNIRRDIKKIRVFSSLIEKKLEKIDNKEKEKIENLSFNELNDLNQLTRAADYILSKYENNKEVYRLLKDFVDMINYSANSVDIMNDQIAELVASAGTAISRIKNLQGDVSENYSLLSPNDEKSNTDTIIIPKSSTNNLTKSTTPLYT